MKHLAGSLRIEVRCGREDLVIDDIQIKDQDLLSKIKNAAMLNNKIFAGRILSKIHIISRKT
jgi:hypothetical protein